VLAQLRAELGERNPERMTHRNGYRPRAWDTRLGQLGPQGMSNDQVSRLCRGLDEPVRVFSERP
jgi:transposase-like protein